MTLILHALLPIALRPPALALKGEPRRSRPSTRIDSSICSEKGERTSGETARFVTRDRNRGSFRNCWCVPVRTEERWRPARARARAPRAPSPVGNDDYAELQRVQQRRDRRRLLLERDVRLRRRVAVRPPLLKMLVVRGLLHRRLRAPPGRGVRVHGALGPRGATRDATRRALGTRASSLGDRAPLPLSLPPRGPANPNPRAPRKTYCAKMEAIEANMTATPTPGPTLPRPTPAPSAAPPTPSARDRRPRRRARACRRPRCPRPRRRPAPRASRPSSAAAHADDMDDTNVFGDDTVRDDIMTRARAPRATRSETLSPPRARSAPPPVQVEGCDRHAYCSSCVQSERCSTIVPKDGRGPPLARSPSLAETRALSPSPAPLRRHVARPRRGRGGATCPRCARSCATRRAPRPRRRGGGRAVGRARRRRPRRRRARRPRRRRARRSAAAAAAAASARSRRRRARPATATRARRRGGGPAVAAAVAVAARRRRAYAPGRITPVLARASPRPPIERDERRPHTPPSLAGRGMGERVWNTARPGRGGGGGGGHHVPPAGCSAGGCIAPFDDDGSRRMSSGIVTLIACSSCSSSLPRLRRLPSTFGN